MTGKQYCWYDVLWYRCNPGPGKLAKVRVCKIWFEKTKQSFKCHECTLNKRYIFIENVFYWCIISMKKVANIFARLLWETSLGNTDTAERGKTGLSCFHNLLGYDWCLCTNLYLALYKTYYIGLQVDVYISMLFVIN